MNYIHGDDHWTGTYEVNALSAQDQTPSSQKVWPEVGHGFHSHPNQPPGLDSRGMYPHGWALLGRGVLELGAEYLLEGFLFNLAGGISTFRTPPFCIPAIAISTATGTSCLPSTTRYVSPKSRLPGSLSRPNDHK